MNPKDEKKLSPQEPASEHMAEGTNTGKGYLTGPGLVEYPVEYTVENEICLHEGCIDLGSEKDVQAEAARVQTKNATLKTVEAAGNDHSSDETDVEMGVGLPGDSSFLWTNGVVPYKIAANLPDKDRVKDAIDHIESNTGIRFVKRTDSNSANYPNYIEVISNGNKGWSSSAIGMRGGRQVVRFSDRHSWRILVHEFLHALGVYHEQSRSDRDEYVEIKWNNIPDGPPPAGENNWTGNFQKKPNSVDYYDYDYGSIMHYGPKSFARDSSKPTIVPLQPGVTIGQRTGMSFGDRLTIAKMYQKYFQRGYSGVWRKGSGKYALWVNASWSSFKTKWQEWSRQGLRLHDIHVQKRGSKTYYSGVFLPGSGSYGLWANVSWASFKAKWEEWSNQGLRLVDFHVHRSNNQNRYSGVFVKGSGGHGLWANTSWNSFKTKWEEWSGKGLRLHDLHIHRVDGQTMYSGVFLKGNGNYGLWANTTWESFVSKWQEWSARGLRLVDLNLHRVGNQIRYSGVFLPGTDPHFLWANVTFEGFKAKWEELAEKDLRLIDFEIANAEDSAMDMADGTFIDQSTELEQADLTEYGGVFDQDLIEDSIKSEVEDGGGGIEIDITGKENGTTVVEQDLESNHGKAFFPNEVVPTTNEPEFNGGAFFGLDSVDESSTMEENKGFGKMVIS